MWGSWSPYVTRPPTTLPDVRTRGLVALAVTPWLLVGCAGAASAPKVNPDVAASAPVPGVTLPPDSLVDLVLRPDEVPAGMVPLLNGSGPRTLSVVAGYSGSGATETTAEAKLTAHGFVKAYVAQYANQGTGQVLSILASQFGTSAGAKADFADDLLGATGKNVVAPTLGEQSAVTLQSIQGSVASELVLVRFRRGTTTWSLAYKAGPTADAQVAIDLAKRLLARTST